MMEEKTDRGPNNPYTGEVLTDEVLLKAGADNIEHVNVANVQLVYFSLIFTFFTPLTIS